MKAYFALFLVIAFLGMAMAGVHHYRVEGNNAKDSAHHGGSIFDDAADGLNAIANGIGHAASGFFG